MDPQQRTDAFIAHLKKHGKPGWDICPICQSRQWLPAEGSLVGLSTPDSGEHVGQYGAALHISIPVAMLFCNTCYFVRQFAIVPIMKESPSKAEAPSDAP